MFRKLYLSIYTPVLYCLITKLHTYDILYEMFQSFCRDHDSQCDESARAWVNMTGYQSRVLGRNIGDRFNPLEMDSNHTVRVPFKKNKFKVFFLTANFDFISFSLCMF